MDTAVLGLGDSLLVAVIGMSIVFLGLVILIFLIKLMTRMTENLGKNRKVTVKAVPAPAPLPASWQNQPPLPEEEEADDALIAAITAAVACVLQEEGSSGGFSVRRVRRIVNAPTWQRYGRETQIRNRF